MQMSFYSGTGKYFLVAVYLVILIINILSLKVIASLKRSIFTKDVSVLTASLAVTSAIAMFLLDILLLKGDETKKTLLSLSCLCHPILYNLFLPHILGKTSKFFCGNTPKSCLCAKTWLFLMLWLSNLIDLVVILSPLKVFDYHKFGSAHHPAEEEIVTNIPRAVVQGVGTVPQTISVLLSFIFLKEIWQHKVNFVEEEKKVALNRNEPPVKSDRHYFADYTLNWGFSSVAFIIPSAGIRFFGLSLHYFGIPTPSGMRYVLMIPDTLLFITQPVCLIMIGWKTFNKPSLRPSNNNICETRFQTSSRIGNSLDPEPPQVNHPFHPMPSVSPISSIDTNFCSANSQQFLITPKITPNSSMTNLFETGSQRSQHMGRLNPNWPLVECSPQASPQRVRSPIMSPISVQLSVTPNISPHASRSNLYDLQQTNRQPTPTRMSPAITSIENVLHSGQQAPYLTPNFGLLSTSSMEHIPRSASANQQFSSTENMTIVTFVSQ